MSYETLKERLLARPLVKASYDQQTRLSRLQKDLATLSRGAQNPQGQEALAAEKALTVEPVLKRVRAHFRGISQAIMILTPQELREVLEADNSADLIIAGQITATDVVLYRGNLESFTVPRSVFSPRPLAAPDFSKFSIIDYGQTIKLGPYEASVDAVLYEFDED